MKVNNLDGAADAFFLTDLTAKAAVLAVHLGELSVFGGGAAYIHMLGDRPDGNQMLGACLDALATGNTLG